MPQADDSSRSLVTFEQNATLIAVIEMSQSSWLVAGTVPGVERQPRKKIMPDETALLRLLHRWRDEAARKGRTVTWIAVVARWLIGHGIEAHVIHPTSVAVSREHRRAKTDRLDMAILMRVHRMAARRTRHCGNNPGRGRQASEPGAREFGRRAHPHRQSLEGGPGAARHRASLYPAIQELRSVCSSSSDR